MEEDKMNCNDVELYIRTRSDDEEQLKEQETRLRKYCQLKGYNVVRVYKDFNYSAHDLTRPQFVELQNNIKNGITKKVVVTNISRISRNMNEAYNFLDLLLEYDCGYDSLDTFDMSTFLGNTSTSLFTFFNTEI